ncbi:MAG TPA: hypothetical protein VHW43_02110 [Puia sp.]|nr:hypothetical protein [Puia sp.]
MANETTREALIGFLNEIGAGSLSHSGRSLMDHLTGTYDLLKKWGCDKATCLAGGLHSVYGTNIFTTESLSAAARPLVRHVFGADAERLAWLFGTLNRPRAFEQGSGLDRRNNASVTLDTKDLRLLRLIEAANLLEQGSSLQRWPNIRKEAELQIHSVHDQ